MSTHEKDSKKMKVEMIVLVALLIVFATLLFVYVARKKSPPVIYTLNPSISANKTPLPTGTQVFNVSVGDIKDNKPKMSLIRIEPLDPLFGGSQKITFQASSPFPIAQVASVVYTDKKTHQLVFNLTKGTRELGEWTATWNVDDTYEKTYRAVFHLVNKSDVRDEEITFR
jgi:hypothetical protein